MTRFDGPLNLNVLRIVKRKSDGFSPSVEITKADNPRNLVFGWANVAFTPDGKQVSDYQGHMIDADELEEAAYRFALRHRTSGGQHRGEAWGEMVESMVFTPDKIEALGLEGQVPVGWWVGFKVPPNEFDKVRKGKWRMFSIQGSAKLEEVKKSVRQQGNVKDDEDARRRRSVDRIKRRKERMDLREEAARRSSEENRRAEGEALRQNEEDRSTETSFREREMRLKERESDRRDRETGISTRSLFDRWQEDPPVFGSGVEKHASPTHPGTGTDQKAHDPTGGGGGASSESASVAGSEFSGSDNDRGFVRNFHSGSTNDLIYDQDQDEAMSAWYAQFGNGSDSPPPEGVFSSDEANERVARGVKQYIDKSRELNDILRDGDPTPHVYRDFLNSFQPIEQDIDLFRGMDMGDLGFSTVWGEDGPARISSNSVRADLEFASAGVEGAIGELLDQRISDRGVLSTSYGMDVALQFSGGGLAEIGDNTAVVAHIKALAGTNAMHIGGLDEAEIVLAPNTELHVKDVKVINGRIHLFTETVVGKTVSKVDLDTGSLESWAISVAEDKEDSSP